MKKESLDDIIKEFEKRSKNAISSNRKLWENTEADEIYDVDIHIWRSKGMGNSLQTISGNKVSILTATYSYINTLLDNKVVTINELENMINLLKETR